MSNEIITVYGSKFGTCACLLVFPQCAVKGVAVIACFTDMLYRLSCPSEKRLLKQIHLSVFIYSQLMCHDFGMTCASVCEYISEICCFHCNFVILLCVVQWHEK